MSTERKYFIARNGQKHGPYTMNELQDYLNKGEIFLNDLWWIRGNPEWLPLTEIEGLDITDVKMPPPPAKDVSPTANQPVFISPTPQAVTQPKNETTPWLAVFAGIICPIIGLIFWIAYMATNHTEKAKAVGWATLLSTVVFGLWFIAALSV